jgi:hypothetical protein
MRMRLYQQLPTDGSSHESQNEFSENNAKLETHFIQHPFAQRLKIK